MAGNALLYRGAGRNELLTPVLQDRGPPPGWNSDHSSAMSPRYLYEHQEPGGIVRQNQLQNYDSMSDDEFRRIEPNMTRRYRPDMGYELGDPSFYSRVPRAQQPLHPDITYQDLLRLLQERWGER